MEDQSLFPTYSNLLNQMTLIPSSKRPYVSVSDGFFRDCMRLMLLNIYVDEPWYLLNYPDIRESIQSGILADARDHYTRFGYYEHRLPYAIMVNSDWYLEQYPDVAESVGGGVFDSAQHHFELLGYREGRFPFPGFGLRTISDPT